MNPFKFVFLFALLAVAPGCSSSGMGGKADLGGSSCVTTYPAGPYGTTAGATIDNLKFVGTQTYNAGAPVNAMLQDFDLQHYRADPKVKVLVILLAAEWCIPCQMEQAGVVTAYNDYKTSNTGVSFVEAVTQNSQYKPATQVTIDNWATSYKIPFDLTVDTGGALAAFGSTGMGAYPEQIIVTTCDMQIQWVHIGIPAGNDLETQINGALAL